MSKAALKLLKLSLRKNRCLSGKLSCSREDVFSDEIKSRIQKMGQPPGTPTYTGNDTEDNPLITTVHYTSGGEVEKIESTSWEPCLSLANRKEGIVWVHMEGLHSTEIVQQIAEHYNLHPLTIEDILNVEQRSKVEEFDNYYFVILRMLDWPEDKEMFSVEQISVVFGKNFVLSFQEKALHLFENIRQRLFSIHQKLHQQGPDYLAYRLIDTIVDQYFLVLEQLSERIEIIEAAIITTPTPEQAHHLYALKHQVLSVRKVIWPMRESISRLLQSDDELISSYTHTYLRDVYDHAAQAIDTLENFRDVLSGMMDIYLSSITSRMNEIMKVLTIIATIFIPITFIASVYGMNFDYMPELHHHDSYFIVLGVMASIVVSMLLYFRRKKWL